MIQKHEPARLEGTDQLIWEYKPGSLNGTKKNVLQLVEKHI